VLRRAGACTLAEPRAAIHSDSRFRRGEVTCGCSGPRRQGTCGAHGFSFSQGPDDETRGHPMRGSHPGSTPRRALPAVSRAGHRPPESIEPGAPGSRQQQHRRRSQWRDFVAVQVQQGPSADFPFPLRCMHCISKNCMIGLVSLVLGPTRAGCEC
jgi:hypothetical protein